MLKIIRPPSTGKTDELIQYAVDHDCIIVCDNPQHMIQKAHVGGFGSVDARSYSWLTESQTADKKILIDELDKFIEYYLNGAFAGFTQTI